ncbi:MAG: hypothetical protein R3A48_24630 [Polyangiales bacterium]
MLRRGMGWVVWALVGCGPLREEVPLTRVCVNGGQWADPSSQTFAVGQPLRVYVSPPSGTCRPLCDEVISQECSLTREGTTFTVRGRVVVDVDCRGRTPPPACSAPGVFCETPPLEAGRYTFTSGTESVTIEVPSTVSNNGVCSSTF